MKFAFYYIIIMLLLCFPNESKAQTLVIKVSNDRTLVALPDVNIFCATDSSFHKTDSLGQLVFTTEFQKLSFTLSHVGFFKKKFAYRFKKNVILDTLTVLLASQETEIREVTVTTTKERTNIENLATRVEAIDKDELNERSLDKPSDISHAVKEQTGIQLQRTSASSGAFNIRMQSLRGKYVQVLKDGMPLFGGLSEYLALPHTSPLSLQQIEIIKGSSSTLYGGDAIAGVVNFISALPSEKPVYNVLFNIESTKSVDIGLYASHRFNKFGYTLLGQYRNQQPKDWDGDKFSDYAKISRWNISPDLYFFINKNITLSAGVTYINETRKGGALPALQNKIDSAGIYSYIESNASSAVQSRLNATIQLDKAKIVIRNGINYYKRDLSIPTYTFNGNQFASYTEALVSFNIKNHKLIIGADFRSDQFTETTNDTFAKRNYSFLTPGIFIQETFLVSPKTILEGGFRLDYNNKYGVLPLPKFAWLQKWNDIFHSRVNFGMGYKLPTIFQDESEQHYFQRITAIDRTNTKAEISYGVVVDMKVVSPSIKGFRVQFNEMFFFTHITNPLMAKTFTHSGENFIRYTTQNGYIQGKGLETTLQLFYKGIAFKGSYTLQDQSLKINSLMSVAPLTSKHIVSLLLGYEKEDKFSVGIDCYYYSKSQLSDGTSTHGIWEMGINGQIITKYVTFFANLENMLNMRQTSFGPVVTPNPTYQQPQFKEIYGPLEGILFNIGCKVKLGSLIPSKSKGDDD
ncbi:MAG: TonB-dependent receptor [Chitinophagales bacterium]